MTLSLLRRKGSHSDGDRTDSWELIGEDSHARRSLDRVPGWLLRRVGRKAGKCADSTSGRQISYLNHRRYRYKVVFSGNASDGMCVYRRRRRRP